MSKGRLQAFTILEVTIAMLLAAIVIGISYTAYTMMSRSYQEYDDRNEKVAEFVLLNKLLRRDISNAEKIVRSPEGINLEGPEGSIIYSFSEEYITRNQYSVKTDTFKVSNSDLITSFEEKEVTEEGMIDRISFTGVLQERKVPLVYVKTYSAEEKFE